MTYMTPQEIEENEAWRKKRMQKVQWTIWIVGGVLLALYTWWTWGD